MLDQTYLTLAIERIKEGVGFSQVAFSSSSLSALQITLLIVHSAILFDTIKKDNKNTKDKNVANPGRSPSRGMDERWVEGLPSLH